MSDKNINVRFNTNGEKAQKDFDGVDVSVKELHLRLADLNKQMKELFTTYGKNATGTASYTRIMREQQSATAQLVGIQEKEIIATQRSVRGLGSLGSASMAAMGSISGLGTGISVLTNSLMSGVGLTAGLAAAVAGFSLLMNYISSSRAEMEKFQSSIKNLITIAGPAGTFMVNPEDLPAQIASLEKKINDYNNAKTTSEGTKGQYEFQNIKMQEALLEVLKDANSTYLEQKSIMDELTSQGLTYVDKKVKETNAIKDQTKALKELVPYLSLEWSQMVSAISGAQTVTPGGGGGFVAKHQTGGKNPLENIIMPTEAELRKEFKTFDIIAQSAAQSMTDMFGEAWNRIFGEANSLLEIFLQNITEGLLSLAAQDISKSIFGFLLSFIPGGSMAAGALAPIRLQIGDQTIASFVKRGNDYLQERNL